MSIHLTRLLMIAMTSIAVLGLPGCAGTRIRELSAPAFLKQAEQTAVVGSFVWTSYIGSSGQRAYLEYGHPAFLGRGMQMTVYWTPLDGLPTNVVAQIKAGMRPWTNWMDRINATVP